MSEKKCNYAAVDLWKFLMSFIIIIIHCDVFLLAKSREAVIYTNLLRNMAISAFFCSNGFFGIGGKDFKNSVSDRKAFWNRWKHNVFRYVSWNLIYLPLMIFGEFIVYQSDLQKAILKIARTFFITGWHYFTWHLWYLLAMIGAMAVVALLLERGADRKKILFAAAVLFLAGAVLDAWQDAEKVPKIVAYYFQIFYNTRNAAFYGMFFVAYGAWTRERRAKKKPDMRIIWILTVAFLAGMYFCRNLPIVPVIFDGIVCCLIFEIVLSVSLRDRPIWKLLRAMSTDMYFIHMYFVALFYLVLRKGIMQPEVITVLGVTACTFSAALILESWKKKKSGRWLCRIF